MSDALLGVVECVGRINFWPNSAFAYDKCWKVWDAVKSNDEHNKWIDEIRWIWSEQIQATRIWVEWDKNEEYAFLFSNNNCLKIVNHIIHSEKWLKCCVRHRKQMLLFRCEQHCNGFYSILPIDWGTGSIGSKLVRVGCVLMHLRLALKALSICSRSNPQGRRICCQTMTFVTSTMCPLPSTHKSKFTTQFYYQHISCIDRGKWNNQNVFFPFPSNEIYFSLGSIWRHFMC